MSKYNLTEIFNESFDSLAKKLDKQKGIDKDDAAKIAGSIAAKKMKGAGSGPTAKQKARVKEEEMSDAAKALLRDDIIQVIDIINDSGKDNASDFMEAIGQEFDIDFEFGGVNEQSKSIKEDEEDEEEEEVVQYAPFVEGETVLRRTERIDRFEYYDYLVNNKEEYDYILENGVDEFIDKYFMDEDQFEYNDIYEKIIETNYNLGNRNTGKLTPIQEDLFSKDGGSEDNVDNIDRVSSPSTKGVGYDQVSKANTAEDDMESKETLNPKPMFEDLKKHFKRFI